MDAAEPTRLPGRRRTGGSGRASVNPSTALAAAAAGRSCCFVHVFICNSLDFTASCLCVSRLFKHHVGVEEFTGPVLPTRFPDTHRRKHSCVCTRYKLAACLSVCLSGRLASRLESPMDSFVARPEQRRCSEMGQTLGCLRADLDSSSSWHRFEFATDNNQLMGDEFWLVPTFGASLRVDLRIG